MRRKKSVVIISAFIIIFAIVAVVIEAFVIGRSAPLAVKDPEPPAISDTEDENSGVVIVLERNQPTASPSPTPKATEAPKASTATPKTETSQAPASQGQDSEQPANGETTTAQTPVPQNATPQEPAFPTKPDDTPVVTPAPAKRPEVIESTPKPTPKPTVTQISLDTYTLNILAGDSWRINIAGAPDTVFSQGATWNTSNSGVIDLTGADLSGVTVKGKTPGTATVTIYSKDGSYSATCTVTVA